MNKFYRIILLTVTFVFLSTYSPNKFEDNSENNNTFFEIEKIIISNNFLVSRDYILSRLDETYGKNIFLIQRKDIEESLQNINFLEKIEVKKKYPNTITIKIFETKPVGILFKDKTQYLLDSSSNLIVMDKKNNFPELPNIVGDEAEKNIISFLDQLQINKFPTEYIKNFFYFKIGRWDLELLDKRIIKFPYNVDDSTIKKTITLINRKDFQIYKIIDLRIDGKIIAE